VSVADAGSAAGVFGIAAPAVDLARCLTGAGASTVLAGEDATAAAQLCAQCGARPAASARELVQSLPVPRTVFLAQPSDEAAHAALAELEPLLAAGDTVVDAGDGHFREAALFAAALAPRGMAFADLALVAGGWSGELGRVLVLGGDPAGLERLRPLLDLLAPPPRALWAVAGPPGSARFLRAVESALRKGLMGTLSEGFEVFGRDGFRLHPADLARVWQRGGALGSELGELAGEFLEAAGWDSASGGSPPAVALALNLQMAARGAELYWRQLMAFIGAPPSAT
jgi:6-phosphogluconate dehydrogenase